MHVKQAHHQPLYRSLFPEWGRVPASYINLDQQQTLTKAQLLKQQKEQLNAQKNKTHGYPMCLTYFDPLQLCVFCLVSDLIIY